MTATQNAQEIRVQRSNVIDLDTMGKVTLVKVFKHIPVKTREEAMALLGTTDENAFVQVLNEGVIAELRRRAVGNPTLPWMALDEETGEPMRFNGTPADSKLVNAAILSLAKAVLGYGRTVDDGKGGRREQTIEEKHAIRAQALALIRNSKEIMEGLRKNATASLVEE